MRILHVEPDDGTADAVACCLAARGFAPTRAGDGEEAVELARLYDWEAVLLEPERLKGRSGLDVLAATRLHRPMLPVLALSSAARVEDKVRLLGAGADDYLTKPFHADELVARLRAVVRRAFGHSRSLIEAGALTLDIEALDARVDGRPVHLTGKEFAMLEALILRRGRCLSRQALMDILYGGRDEPDVKIVDVFVCKLRKKLGRAGAQIETVWGRGFVLRDHTCEARAA